MTRRRIARLRVACLMIGCCAALALAKTAVSSLDSASTQPAALTSFAREAAVGGMSEVELGRLAVEKGTNPEVKALGKEMIEDHSKANADLKSLAARVGVALPDEVGAEQEKTLKKLSALSGAAFDRAYITDMVEDHKTDVEAFEKAARVAGTCPIKLFAAEKLPTLRHHLQMAEQAQATLANSAAPATGTR